LIIWTRASAGPRPSDARREGYIRHCGFRSLDLDQDWASLPSRAALLAERGARELDAPPSPAVQPPWDIPDLIAITTAVSGRVARESDTGAPASYPLDFDGFPRAAIVVLEAGACGVHIDFGGIPAIQESGLSVSESYATLIPAIRAATDLTVTCGASFAERHPSPPASPDGPMAPNFPRP
jgi:hypothetical protein